LLADIEKQTGLGDIRGELGQVDLKEGHINTQSDYLSIQC